MKLNKSLLALCLVFGFAIVYVLVASLKIDSRPVTVQFLRQTNSINGGQFAFFTLSNRTHRPVVFLANSNGLPLHMLNESTILSSNGNSVSFAITNHNQQQFLTSRQATLPPRSDIDFTVEIPSSVTNATLLLNYMGKGTLKDLILKNYRKLQGFSGEPYTAIEIQQPFGENNALSQDE